MLHVEGKENIVKKTKKENIAYLCTPTRTAKISERRVKYSNTEGRVRKAKVPSEHTRTQLGTLLFLAACIGTTTIISHLIADRVSQHVAAIERDSRVAAAEHQG